MGFARPTSLRKREVCEEGMDIGCGSVTEKNMDRSPILFRVDSNAESGYAGIYQGLTFALAVQRRRRLSYFLGQIEPFSLLSQIARAGNEYLKAENPFGTPEDAEETIAEARRIGAANVVLCAHDLSEEYLRELTNQGLDVTVFDTQANICFSNRLVINPLLGKTIRDYQYETGTQLLIGAKYALIRPMFRRQRPMRAVEPTGAKRAVLALGEDDFFGESLTRTIQLLNNPQLEKITVLVRSHHNQINDLRELMDQNKGRLEILTEPSELANRLPKTHVAITSGDSLSLEMACVGVPQIILAADGVCLANGQCLDNEGAATVLGMWSEVSENQLNDQINYVLDDVIERIGMSRCAKNLIDGKGADRLVNGLEIMLHTTLEPHYRRLAA
jgi:spore coat polysaccharide biosynthesis predicted glycosyltransferase SpsG